MDTFITTPAQENYIERIYRMSTTQPVKPSELAESLGVRRASVTRLINTLVDKGLVLHKSHGDIALTKLGDELARAIVRRDECLTRLLVEVCGMDPDRADTEVHRLEHVINDEVLVRFETLVEFACSSDEWLGELKKRTEQVWSKHPLTKPGPVGRTQIHQGYTNEKYVSVKT